MVLPQAISHAAVNRSKAGTAARLLLSVPRKTALISSTANLTFHQLLAQISALDYSIQLTA
jgi:hypothetical protein